MRNKNGREVSQRMQIRYLPKKWSSKIRTRNVKRQYVAQLNIKTDYSFFCQYILIFSHFTGTIQHHYLGYNDQTYPINPAINSGPIGYHHQPEIIYINTTGLKNEITYIHSNRMSCHLG